ncbi:hypothetical protein GSS88_04200 [Corynebacterium sp. 3HC-13]|uniref:Rv1157c family protein n=1 Tax=Corynebacterium poyangense TaxID=2684405 RepID=UPI001CCC9265|nr:hypothetical protein [Corynebacterium poyangense]MBZ8177000.1 hypothetical protein [Corynebacterium poyangense]
MPGSARRLATALGIGMMCFGAVCGTGSAQAEENSLTSPEHITMSDSQQVVLPVDHLGRPTPDVLNHISQAANTPGLPDQLRSAMLAAVAFYSGNMGGGPEIPAGGPVIHQFGWPSVAGHCINGQADSLGTALAVVGPSDIPAPGAGPHDTAFLFTALGTSAALANQADSMKVHWINLNTLHYDTTPLANHGINPNGPATVSGVAPTGRGYLLAVLDGSVLTQDAECHYSPTAAIIDGR